MRIFGCVQSDIRFVFHALPTKYLPGVFGFFATRAIHTQLEAMRKVTEIAQDQGSKSDEEPRNGLEVTFPVLEEYYILLHLLTQPLSDLDVKTLGELTRCPNPDIQFLWVELNKHAHLWHIRFTNSYVFCSYSATKFVAYQTFNSPSYDLLIECLASKNPSRRDKALICLHFLISHREPRRTRKCIWLKKELRGSCLCR